MPCRRFSWAHARRFAKNVAACEHFAGEEPYDEERRLEIRAAMNEFCGNARKRLPALKEKYRQDVEILRMLSICEKDSAAVCASAID